MSETPEAKLYRTKLIEELTFEVIPLKSLDAAVEALPERATVSVTCSPAKGIDETIRLTDEVRAKGHTAIPHIAARMVEGPEHVAKIANWMRTEEIGYLFLVGGDAEPPAGPFNNAADFLKALLDAGPELHTIGVTSYPDGHALIPTDALDEALAAKQAILTEAGVNGYASTQMCFDADKILSWLRSQRAAGIELPVHLGISGVVDRTKLLTMGTRLGIGNSLSYLKKNRKAISKLLTQSDYDPNNLLVPMSDDLAELNISGLHCFTFNQVAATEAWRQEVISDG